MLACQSTACRLRTPEPSRCADRMNCVRHPDRAPARQTELFRLSANLSTQGGTAAPPASGQYSQILPEPSRCADRMNCVRHPDRAPARQTEPFRLSANPSTQGKRHRLHDADRSVLDSARNPLAQFRLQLEEAAAGFPCSADLCLTVTIIRNW